MCINESKRVNHFKCKSQQKVIKMFCQTNKKQIFIYFYHLDHLIENILKVEVSICLIFIVLLCAKSEKKVDASVQFR